MHSLPSRISSPRPGPASSQRAAPHVALGDGVIYSTADYGCLWSGQGREGARPTTIRSALEWGTNIVAYALARQAKANAQTVVGP